MEVLEMNYDLTDNKHWKQKPEERERLACLGTMAAVFAHELANPLAGLTFSLQFVEIELERKQFHDARVRVILEGAMQEIHRLRALLDGFRSLAVPQSLELEFTDLETIIKEVLALEHSNYGAAGVTVKLDFEKRIPLIKLDRGKIKQVILNLCKNGIEAMPEGGCLTLKIYRSEPMVVFEISDNGIGIPDGVNIFELFKTTKLDGSGLGLPLVQRIVSAHNGTINYTTQQGRGTTFKITLPATI